MFPGFVMNNITNGLRTNRVSPREYSHTTRPVVWNTFTADSPDLLFRQLGASLPNALRCPVFLCSVPHVFGLGSKKKASRIATGRIVAVVENPKTFRDRSVCKGPSKAMGVIANSSETKPAIPKIVFGSGPFPAFVASTDTDLLPEPENVLRRQRRDAMMFPSHDRLLSRRSWSGRFAGHSASRPLYENGNRNRVLGQGNI